MYKATRILFGVFLLVAMTSSAYGDDFYNRLNNFFKQTFPDEGFVATPYGADDRFAPRTIWIQVPNASGKRWLSNKANAWIPFSAGTGVYTETLVPLRRRGVAVKIQQLDAGTKLALGAAINAAVQVTDVDAKVEYLRSRNATIDIDLGEVEVEYAYYADFLNAQLVNQHILATMTDMLKRRFGNDLPSRRVITAALRVRGAKISLKGEGATNLSADATVAPWLKEIGFEWNATRNAFESLTTGNEWKYIAYQSLVTDPNGIINNAAALPEATDFATATEATNEIVRRILTPAAAPPANQ